MGYTRYGGESPLLLRAPWEQNPRYETVEYGQRSLPDVLAYNLETLGVNSMQEEVSLQPFATLLTCSRAATPLFAVDSNIVMQVANAWSFALDGTPAYRIDTSQEYSVQGQWPQRLTSARPRLSCLREHWTWSTRLCCFRRQGKTARRRLSSR